MPLILFDIDGTLLRNAGGHHREAIIAGIKHVTGVTTTFDGVDTSGRLDRDLIHAVLQAAGASNRRIQTSMALVMAACQARYLENCPAELSSRVCPGVPQLLSDLKRHGVTLGLVTGNLSLIGWKKMEKAGLRDFFSVAAFAEDGRTRARVAQVARWRAIRQGLVSRTAPVALIGDHGNDIRAAQANRFLSVAVGTGLTPLEDLQAHEPDILVRDLTQLEAARLLGHDMMSIHRDAKR